MGLTRSAGLEAITMGSMADIDEMMYSCGLEILHPGGIEKTDEMARMCGIAKARAVLDVGCGKGATADYLAREYGCAIVGIDTSDRMIDYAVRRSRKRGLGDRVTFRRADAQSLPFQDERFDIVLAECTTVLLEDKGKAFSEFLRVLRRGGYVGDLEMTWRETPPAALAEKACDVWEGFRTMTLARWQEFCESVGMVDVKTVDFSETMDSLEEVMERGLGAAGKIKMLCRLLSSPHLARSMIAYLGLWREIRDYVGYGYVVGRKA